MYNTILNIILIILGIDVPHLPPQGCGSVWPLHIPQHGTQTWTEDIDKIIVADPDPKEPYVFGPPGSGSISQRYPDLDPSIIKQK
jgi:hypothetical protein